jgi:hypothetical protein
MHIYDGMPIDGIVLLGCTANTIIVSRFKAGKLVGIGTLAVSQDGKTLTNPETGIRADGQPYDVILVYEKQ